MIDVEHNPYTGRYVIKIETSPELAAMLERDPEARKEYSDALHSAIIAALPSSLSVKEVMDPAKVQTR